MGRGLERGTRVTLGHLGASDDLRRFGVHVSHELHRKKKASGSREPPKHREALFFVHPKSMGERRDAKATTRTARTQTQEPKAATLQPVEFLTQSPSVFRTVLAKGGRAARTREPQNPKAPQSQLKPTTPPLS